jgi:hypothetical protein
MVFFLREQALEGYTGRENPGLAIEKEEKRERHVFNISNMGGCYYEFYDGTTRF